MESFSEFVTNRRIIECVAKKRAMEAAKRHKSHHFHLLSESYIVHEPQLYIYEVTPPRRNWVQLGKNKRLSIDQNGQEQTISSFERTKRSVYETIMRDIRKGYSKPYLDELNALIDNIKDRINNPEFNFSSPKTIPLLKKRHKDAPDEYRPICIFEDLADAIIIVLANKYLTRLFDDFFYEDSLAFRPKREFHNEFTTTTHHSAVTLINQYLEKVKQRKIYVAECDMQKFYDTVDHSIVREEYDRLISEAEKEYPDLKFDNISRIFYSYLNCYTFVRNVWDKNNDKKYWEEFKIMNGHFKWVKELQEVAKLNNNLALGVPQGGALSGLIANIVINRVDQELVPYLHYANDLYIRFCDDMLLLSTNKRRCQKLLNRYNHGIRKVKLFPHKAEKTPYGTSEYWKSKSKSIYRWVADNKALGSRWIGFVGYEMNRNGEIRIRKDSIKKEKRKQRRVINDLFKLTYRKQRVVDSSMQASYQNTLISMAVGRVTIWNYKTIKNELCWINGFIKLNSNPIVMTQIRDLDRYRNRVIHNADRRLSRLESRICGKIPKEGNNKKDKNGQELNKQSIYNGLPFSYFYHYQKNVRNLLEEKC